MQGTVERAEGALEAGKRSHREVRDLKERIERLKLEEQEATRKGDYESRGADQVRRSAAACSASSEAKRGHGRQAVAHAERRSGRGRCRQDRQQVDRHSGLQDAGGRSEEAGDDGRAVAGARGRAGPGHRERGQCHTPFARGTKRSAAADRVVHLPGPDRRGQDRAGACAGGISV